MKYFSKLFLLFFIVNSLYAVQRDKSFNLKTSVGYTLTDLEIMGTEFSDGEKYGLGIEYFFNNNIGIEISYSVSNPEYSFNNLIEDEIKIKSSILLLNYYYDLTPQAYCFFRAGVAKNSAETDITISTKNFLTLLPAVTTTINIKIDETEFAYGCGAGLEIIENLMIEASYNLFGEDLYSAETSLKFKF